MPNERDEELIREVRALYHRPGDVPREPMWEGIERRLEERASSEERTTAVVDLAAERERRMSSGRGSSGQGMIGLAVAAAAVLVLGVGIGRVTAPTGEVETMASDAPTVEASEAVTRVAQEHFGRTESLLTMARADARVGRMDPMTAEWARTLLSETRLLLDAHPDDASPVATLLSDLELVLIQVVGAAETGSMDEALGRTELELALRSLEEGEVLPRIQAAAPNVLAGT